jgi:hypothetical protein
MNPFRALSRTAWLIIAGCVAAVLLLSTCQMLRESRERERQADADAALSEGRTTSAVEAITAIGELGQRADATDAQVKEAQDAVRQAAPDDRDRVFRHRVCVLQQRPDCDRLLRASAGGADHANASR